MTKMVQKRNKSVRFYEPQLYFNDCGTETINDRCDEQSWQIRKDQLVAVCIKKHNDFLSAKNSTNKKTTRREGY